MVTDASTYLNGAPYSVFSALNGTNVTIGKLVESPILLTKAVKNDVEAEGMVEAHVKDAIALCKFAAKLEEEIQAGNNWTEISAAELLLDYRKKQKDNKGISFHSISARPLAQVFGASQTSCRGSSGLLESNTEKGGVREVK